MKGLSEFQSLLSGLYVRKDDRDYFFEHKERISQEFKPVYQRNLIGLQKNQVEIFANSLILKRFGIVMSMLPLMEKHFLDKVKSLFFSYSLNKPLQQSSGKYTADRDAFIAFLRKKATGDLAVLADLYHDELKMDKPSCVLFKKQVYQLDRFWDIITEKPQRAVRRIIYFKIKGRVVLNIKY